jgi:O-antigen ligase
MALPLILLIINSPRVTIMATIAALVLFMVFFSRAKYASLLQVAFPVFIVAAVLALLYFFSTFTTAFSSDYSYTTRVDSAERAWSVLLRYPLLGFGQDSQQSISYQEVIGPYFHPLDIGLLGIAFQFGVIGVALYLMFSVWIVVNMLSLWQRNRGQAEPAQVAFLWAMCILFLAWLVASPLQANFILAENIPIVALAWGLSMIHKHGTASRFPLTERSAGHPRPVTAT